RLADWLANQPCGDVHSQHEGFPPMVAPKTTKRLTDEQRQELDAAFEGAKRAVVVVETYSQDQVDRLCRAVAWAVENKRTFTRLVEMGIAESGLGDADSRMGKRLKIRGVLRD